MKEIELAVFKQFYKIHQNELTINDFEDWLYNEPVIEDVMGKDVYFDLINLNYRDKFISNELEKVIYKHIPFSYFECHRLKENLKSVIYGEGDLVELLNIVYADYCHGYNFLRFLGLISTSLNIDNMLRVRDVADVYALSFIENRIGLFKHDKVIQNEAIRILTFLEDDLLKIKAEFEYEDFRNEEDKIEIHDVERLFKQMK
jgi:hypothetical protein